MQSAQAWALALALIPATAGAADATFDPLEPQSNSSVAQAALMAAYDSLVKLTDTGNRSPVWRCPGATTPI